MYRICDEIDRKGLSLFGFLRGSLDEPSISLWCVKVSRLIFWNFEASHRDSCINERNSI